MKDSRQNAGKIAGEIKKKTLTAARGCDMLSKVI